MHTLYGRSVRASWYLFRANEEKEDEGGADWSQQHWGIFSFVLRKQKGFKTKAVETKIFVWGGKYFAQLRPGASFLLWSTLCGWASLWIGSRSHHYFLHSDDASSASSDTIQYWTIFISCHSTAAEHWLSFTKKPSVAALARLQAKTGCRCSKWMGWVKTVRPHFLYFQLKLDSYHTYKNKDTVASNLISPKMPLCVIFKV